MREHITVDQTPVAIATDNRTAASGKTYTYCRGSVPIGTDPENGRPHLRSYRGRTPDEIREAIEQDRYSEGFRTVTPALSCDITVSDIIDHYKETAFARYADTTLVSKNNYLSYIHRYAGKISLEDLDVLFLHIFQSQLLYEEGLSPGQVNGTMTEFHHLIRFAQGENIPVCDPFPYIISLQVDHKVYVIPTMEQLQIFQHNLQPYETLGDLINAIIYLGVRMGEAQALCFEDLVNGQFISINKHIRWTQDERGGHNKLVPNRKMNDTYCVTCPEPAMNSIKHAVERQSFHQHKSKSADWNPTHFIFVDKNGYPTKGYRIRYIVRKVGESAGIPDFSPHSLRRVLAYNLFRRTGDIRLVQTQLGHIVPSSTALYILKNVSAVPSPCSISNNLERMMEHE